MTAPTSPGVVPADVLVAAREALAAQFECSVQAFPYHPKRIRGGLLDNTYEIKAIVRAIMADRANRPSLTEDEREQVRREALEEAAQRADAYWNSNTVPPYYGACPVAARIRALATPPEPRQEKEDRS